MPHQHAFAKAPRIARAGRQISAIAIVCAAAAPSYVAAQAAQPAAAPPGISWSAGPALEQGRDHHAVFAGDRGDRLYVAGGTNYRDMLADVWSARVRPDGSVEAWQRMPDLPGVRGGSAAVIVDGVAVFVAGQLKDLTKVADVFTARVKADGTLEAWQPAPPLPAGRFHHAIARHGNAIYVTGGQGPSNTSEPEVYVARVENGRLSEWREAGRMPRPRSHHASLVHDGFLYVIAGLDGNPAAGPALYTDVRRAQIRDDGTLGDWQLVSLMPYAYGTHSAFVSGGALYVMGGVEDNFRFVDRVWRAPVRPDGRLGAWEEVKPGLPAVRGHVHVTPVINGRVYSLGGSAMRQVRTQLDVGVLPPPPAPPAPPPGQ
jgi:hypothetical protein